MRWKPILARVRSADSNGQCSSCLRACSILLNDFNQILGLRLRAPEVRWFTAGCNLNENSIFQRYALHPYHKARIVHRTTGNKYGSKESRQEKDMRNKAPTDAFAIKKARENVLQLCF